MNWGKGFSVNTYCVWFNSLQSLRIIDCLRVLSVWSLRRRCWGRDTKLRWGPRRGRERSRRRRITARLWHGTMQRTSACSKSGAVDVCVILGAFDFIQRRRCMKSNIPIDIYEKPHLPIDRSQSGNVILRLCLVEYWPFLDYYHWLCTFYMHFVYIALDKSSS